MTLPNFLIAGVAKCGTTSLADWLREHPQVFVSVKKEPWFFSDDANWEKGLDWYAEHFAAAPADAIAIGEATPHYVSFPESVKRIQATLPDARWVVIVRDPVERTYSSWRHRHFRAAQEPRDFDTLVRDELAEDPVLPAPGNCCREDLRHLTPGRYAEQLEFVYAEVERERVLVLLLNDLEERPQETFAEVCRFIGVADDFVPESVGVKRNPHREYRPVWLWTFFTRHRVLERLPAGLGRFIALKLMLRKRDPKDPISPETRRQLREYFAEPDRRLAALIGRDLPWTR
jgi:hypothetical protein